MMRFVFVGFLFAGSTVFADYSCNKTYYLQSATQIMRRGPGPTWNPTTVVTNLSPDLAGITVILPEMRYVLPLSFTDNLCTDTTTPANVVFWRKDPGATAVFRRDTNSNYARIQLYDSLFTDLGLQPTTYSRYLNWFAFNDTTKDARYLKGYMGRQPGAGTLFEGWYGIAYMADSVCGGVTCSPSPRSSYVTETFGPVDSAFMDTAIYLAYGWRDSLSRWSASRHVWLTVQTIKLSFDTVAPLALRPPGVRVRLSFSAWQQGSMVWIHAGRDLAARGGTVELYDMFGRKTADLRPSGHLYSWNGKNLVGGDASPGLYFARTGNRVLGKFVYAR